MVKHLDLGKRWFVAVLTLCAIFPILSGCGTFDQEIYDSSFDLIEESAQTYAAQGDHGQAIILARALLDAEPDDAEADRILRDSLAEAPKLRYLQYKNLLGSNVSDRVTNDDFPLWAAIALYLPNRVLDMMDMIGVEGGVCIGLGAKVQATEALGVGAQVTGGEFMVGLERRHLSARSTLDEFIDVFPFEVRTLVEARAYTGGVYAIPYAGAGIKVPSDKIYQRAKDYWAVGGQVQAIIFGASARVHPIEMWDFLFGFAMVDVLHDDIGTTRKLRLERNEQEAITRLAQQVRFRE